MFYNFRARNVVLSNLEKKKMWRHCRIAYMLNHVHDRRLAFSTCLNVISDMCAQRRMQSACASAHFDQCPRCLHKETLLGANFMSGATFSDIAVNKLFEGRTKNQVVREDLRCRSKKRTEVRHIFSSEESTITIRLTYNQNVRWSIVTENPLRRAWQLKTVLTNSLEPDQTPQNAASDQDLHCLY